MRAWRVIRLGERLSLEEPAAGVQRLAEGVTVGRVVHVRETH